MKFRYRVHQSAIANIYKQLRLTTALHNFTTALHNFTTFILYTNTFKTTYDNNLHRWAVIDPLKGITRIVSFLQELKLNANED